jgi:hypothetical protein
MAKKKKYAFQNPLPEWSTAQQLFVLGQIDEGKTQREVYNEFTAETSTRPGNVERWTGTFAAYKRRLQRLTKNGIDPGIDLDTGEKRKFDLSLARGRYDWWLWLAQSTTDRSTRLSAMTMVEKLAPKFGGDTDDAVTAREIQKRGYHLLNDFQLFGEVVSMTILERVDCQADEVTTLLSEIICSSNMPCDIRNEVIKRAVSCSTLELAGAKESETATEKIDRLRCELQSLSEADLAILERIDDNESSGGDSDGGDGE